jgi:hypothetical protein
MTEYEGSLSDNIILLSLTQYVKLHFLSVDEKSHMEKGKRNV